LTPYWRQQGWRKLIRLGVSCNKTSDQSCNGSCKHSKGGIVHVGKLIQTKISSSIAAMDCSMLEAPCECPARPSARGWTSVPDLQPECEWTPMQQNKSTYSVFPSLLYRRHVLLASMPCACRYGQMISQLQVLTYRLDIWNYNQD